MTCGCAKRREAIKRMIERAKARAVEIMSRGK
jgi:hypothetical protein